MGGSISKALAIEIRWRSPPDKALTALADQRIIAVGQTQDEFMGISRPRGRNDLLVAGLWHAVSNVLGDSAKKQERLLKNQPNIAPVFGNRQGSDVDAIKAYGPLRYIIETAYQVYQGALARTAMADKAYHFARRYIQVDAAHNRAVAIPEAHVAQFNASLARARYAPAWPLPVRWRRDPGCRRSVWRRPLPFA